MSRILYVLGAGEPTYSSSKGLLHALLKLGHEVFSVGRAYFGRAEADAILPPRDHIEWYTYREILDHSPWPVDQIDLLINFEPGGYCCGAMLREVIKAGNYLMFANLQPNYSHFFTDLVKVHTSIPAFDERRFKIDVSTEPVCDIAFCGQAGLALTKEHWDNPDGQDGVGKYIYNLKDRLPTDHRKYEFNWLPSYDYSERGEFLYRLSQDFDVRIYEPLWDEKLQLCLQKGRIGFQRSILNDVAIRMFEYMASGRIPLVDKVADEQDFGVGWEIRGPMTYRSNLYRSFYQNFDCEYRHVARAVNIMLEDRSAWFDDGNECRQYAFENHAWKNRAQEILRIVGI